MPSQSFSESLKNRRAVRRYTGERVPRESERVARAARRGPNAGVTVGHLAEDHDWDRPSSVFSRRRRAHDEVVRWNRWAS